MNETVAWSSPAAATTLVGGDGLETGVTAFDGAEFAEVPGTEFCATAVKVYATPGVRPVTSHVVAGAYAMQVNPPGDEVTT